MLVIPSTISACVPESVELILGCEQWSVAAAQSLMWKSKLSQSRTWSHRWKRETWIQLLCSRTCTTSHGGSLLDWWTSFLAGSRVNHSATRASVMAWKIRGTYGRPSLEDSTLFDRPASSLKTSMESPAPNRRDTTTFSTMSSATWKDWVTEQRRECLQQQKLARRTCENGGSSLVFATPTATANQTAPSMQKHPGCKAIWSTPRATSINETQESAQERMDRLQQEGRQTGGTRSLQNDVQKNWPTPSAEKLSPNTKNPADLVSKHGEQLKPGEKPHDARTGKPVQTALVDHVRQNWPTPTGIHADRGNHDEPVANYQKRVKDYEDGKTKGKPGKSLGVAVNWPTPDASGEKYRLSGNSQQSKSLEALSRQGRVASGLAVPENHNTNGNIPELLNPDWVEQLMGFPSGWTDCVRLATQSYQQSQQEHSQNSGSGSHDG